VLVTPKGGKRNGETELGILDFQSSPGSLLNPIEHYLGTRESMARIDHTLVTAEGVNLRTINDLGQQQRVFYRGMFKNFLTNEKLDRQGKVQPSLCYFAGEEELLEPIASPDVSWTYIR
jgi:hypothetical protein